MPTVVVRDHSFPEPVYLALTDLRVRPLDALSRRILPWFERRTCFVLVVVYPSTFLGRTGNLNGYKRWIVSYLLLGKVGGVYSYKL